MKVLKSNQSGKSSVLLIDGFAFVCGDYCTAHLNLSVPSISVSSDEFNSKIEEYQETP